MTTYDTSNRGTWVIIRCFGGKARRVRVWEENDVAVWVVSDEDYRKRTDGAIRLGPYVGFHYYDVYRDDPELFEEDVPHSASFFEQLTPWR